MKRKQSKLPSLSRRGERDGVRQAFQTQQEVRREVVEELQHRGIDLQSLDQELLNLYCAAQSLWVSTMKLLASADATAAHDAHAGRPRLLGLDIFKKDFQARARRILAEADALGANFGLTPKDRRRIHKIPGAAIPRPRPGV